MTRSDDEADHEFLGLYEALRRTRKYMTDLERDYYRALLAMAERRGNNHIASLLGIHKTRVSQLLAQARERLSHDPPEPS